MRNACRTTRRQRHLPFARTSGRYVFGQIPHLPSLTPMQHIRTQATHFTDKHRLPRVASGWVPGRLGVQNMRGDWETFGNGQTDCVVSSASCAPIAPRQSDAHTPLTVHALVRGFSQELATVLRDEPNQAAEWPGSGVELTVSANETGIPKLAFTHRFGVVSAAAVTTIGLGGDAGGVGVSIGVAAAIATRVAAAMAVREGVHGDCHEWRERERVDGWGGRESEERANAAADTTFGRKPAPHVVHSCHFPSKVRVHRVRPSLTACVFLLFGPPLGGWEPQMGTSRLSLSLCCILSDSLTS